MHMAEKYLSIVIPCYNESKKIHKDIEEVFKFFNTFNINGELIIIDDGSKDDTYKAAERFTNMCPGLKVIRYKNNRGKGYALKTGILSASGEYILFADSGLCVPFDNVFRGIKVLENGAHIGIGSRRAEGSKIVKSQPWYRILGSMVFQFIVKSIIGLPEEVNDSQCGFKVFPKSVAHWLYGQCVIERFMIDIEMILRAKKANLKMAEFSVEWTNDPDTRYSLVKGTIQNMKQLIKIKYIVGRIPKNNTEKEFIYQCKVNQDSVQSLK